MGFHEPPEPPQPAAGLSCITKLLIASGVLALAAIFSPLAAGTCWMLFVPPSWQQHECFGTCYAITAVVAFLVSTLASIFTATVAMEEASVPK